MNGAEALGMLLRLPLNVQTLPYLYLYPYACAHDVPWIKQLMSDLMFKKQFIHVYVFKGLAAIVTIEWSGHLSYNLSAGFPFSELIQANPLSYIYKYKANKGVTTCFIC